MYCINILYFGVLHTKDTMKRNAVAGKNLELYTYVYAHIYYVHRNVGVVARNRTCILEKKHC